MMMRKGLYLLVLMVGASACSFFRDAQDEPIAEAFGKKLYISDVKNIFPEGVKPSDSLAILKGYIDSWTRKQILLNIAEENLSSSDKDVEQELDDYRSTLLINRYEQQFLNQKLDTNVSKEEIQKVYSANSQSFVLTASIVKALYIKIKTTSPYLDKIRSLYKAGGESSMKELESIGRQAAENFDYFNDKWVFFNEILSELPTKPANADEFLVKNPNFEQHDNAYTYFVSVRQYKLKGSLSPFDYEMENIKSVILNKRRQELIENLEKGVFENAKRQKKVKVYVDNK
jgi:hypothetical protein